MYKKIFFAVFTLIILSCSSSDDGVTSGSSISPPGWIQGTWLMQETGTGDMGWRFTSNDFIIIQSGFEISNKDLIATYISNGQEASVENISTAESYEVRLNFPAGQSTTYSFTRISDSEIQWDTAATVLYVKQ